MMAYTRLLLFFSTKWLVGVRKFELPAPASQRQFAVVLSAL